MDDDDVAELARITQEMQRRERVAKWRPEALAFGPQRRFLEDKSKRKAACCSRRSGKTVSDALDLLFGATTAPWANQEYITLSLKNARRLVWPELVHFNREFSLGGVPHNDEEMRFPHLPGCPTIYIAGCKDKEEIEKARGIKVKKAIVDEAQSIRPSILKPLIDDVIEPSLLDFDGQLIITGTPGPIKAGFFYDITQGAQASGWSQHAWTLLDNPHLQRQSGKPPQQIIAELLERRKWTRDNPTFVREYLGRWVTDLDALVLHYDARRNGECVGPEWLAGWTYVVAVDLGMRDADAIAVLGWAPHSQVIHVVYQDVVRKQSISVLGDKVKAVYDKYRPVGVVVDFGGLGAKIGDELQGRWQLPVKAAVKTNKAANLALLDDALLTGQLRARDGSPFADDCATTQWDQDARARGEQAIDDSTHSDIIDAVLYGYRECKAWCEDAPEAPPRAEDYARLREERLAEAEEQDEARPWWAQ